MPSATPTADAAEASSPLDAAPPKLSTAYDLYIDLLGSFVPGLVAVALGGGAIVATVVPLLHVLSHATGGEPGILIDDYYEKLSKLLATLHWEIATVAGVSAFVVGSIFYRQDPKGPDSLSALRAWMHARPEDRRGMAVQPGNPQYRLMTAPFNRWQRWQAYFRPRHFIRKLDIAAEFPYLNLRCYLVARGLGHLARLVPWCPGVGEQHDIRTKMFINLLKIRLFAYFPNLCRDIVRNEAHVRLATSIWYASGALRALAVFLLVVMGAAVAIRSPGTTLQPFFLPAVFTVSVLGFSVFMRAHLRQCVHYMRVREALYVLEATYVAKKNDPKKIFSEFGAEPGQAFEVRCADHAASSAPRVSAFVVVRCGEARPGA